jgi:hypothetical protein
MVSGPCSFAPRFKARAIDLYRFSEGARLAGAGIGPDTFRKWVVLRLTESEQVHLVVRRSAPDRMHADQIPRTRPVGRSPDLTKTRWT